ncbi:MAG: UbiD family decarboxylase [Rhodospirillaceae bacterium]|jgi:UbiD family decarboxylase|nr:UbiD family decarboxylase [Rhodospirillaceae bacterium]MBT7268324.1 UbiD family decarboxylase [Rhodospirillaceae bacterium]
MDKMTNADHHISFNNIRDWISETEKLGELRHIKGASWEEDIGLATELLQHDENAPCALFDEIPGYQKGFRVLTNFFGGTRQNMTLGFPTNFSKVELSNAFQPRYRDAIANPIPHVVVDDGPVLENVIEGDDVDVFKFPTPKWHEADGGRYIGTGSFNVTRDPVENWINVGTYRVMINDKNTVGFYISPGKHGRIHRQKYTAEDEPMPVLVVCGFDPLTFLMTSTEVPYGICEYDVAGALRGKAMNAVLGKHTGLPMPAEAEIVLEGFCYPGKTRPEGPFGEWTGFYGNPIHDGPVIDVKAIYHRNDPILIGCPPQRPPEEQARYRAVVRSALLKEQITQAGVPDVTAVWCHEVGGSRMFNGVSIKQRYPGHATQAGHIADQCRVGGYAGKYTVVVDDDIDVSDLGDLMWALAFRSDPATSIDIIKNAWSTGLDPSIPPDQKAIGNFTNSRAVIDACRPYHWRDQYPKVNMPSPEVWAKAKEKWGYLLK